MGGTACDSPNQTLGPIPLPLNIRETYVIRAHFFGDPDILNHNYLRCITVTSHPELETTPIATGSWGTIKSLFR